MREFKTAWGANLARDAAINRWITGLAGNLRRILHGGKRLRVSIRGRRLRNGIVRVRVNGYKAMTTVIPPHRAGNDGFWNLKEGSR